MYRLSLKPLQKPLESSHSLILPPYSQMERPQTLLRTIRFTPENHSHTPELNWNPLVERFLDSTMQSHFRRISTSVSWLSCTNVTVEVTDQIKDASDAIEEVYVITETTSDSTRDVIRPLCTGSGGVYCFQILLDIHLTPLESIHRLMIIVKVPLEQFWALIESKTALKSHTNLLRVH